MASKKNAIKSGNFANPAEAFFTKPLTDPEEVAPAVAAPEGYKVNPIYIEKKSRRLQVLIQPSLYELLKERAEAEGKSVNDMLHSILEHELKGE